MKKGFTMIELIFVIVIIGILAAVAIPKLAATRDDAKVATAASEVAMALSDIGTYYTAQGHFGTIGEMTNVKFYTGASGGTTDANTTDLNGSTVNYQAGTGIPCLTFTGTTTDGNLTIAAVTASTNSICVGLNKAVTKIEAETHSFGGSSVNFN